EGGIRARAPPPRPRPPPRARPRAQRAPAARDRDLRWDRPVPDRPRRAAGRDLAAPCRLRPRPDPRLQHRPRRGDDRDRGPRRQRQAGLLPRRPRRRPDPAASGDQRARRPRPRPSDDPARAPEGDVDVFGLDDWIAHLSNGATLLAVAGVAVLLGLRHATDPDHLAAVTTLVASGRERTKTLAARLGLTWGLGHATSLFAFGLPIVLFKP